MARAYASRPSERPANRPLPSTRRFASPAVRAVMQRRWHEFLGIVSGLSGLAVLVALASYDPTDPSISTATSRGVVNLAGPLGAAAADVLLQGFGWAAPLPGLALLGWAWRLGSHQGLALFPARVAAVLAALPALAAVLSMTSLPGPVLSGPGGIAGILVSASAARLADAALGSFGAVMARGAIGMVALALSVVALGVSPGEWLRLVRATSRSARGAARFGGAVAGRFRRAHRPAPARRRPGLLARIAAGLQAPLQRRSEQRIEPGADLAAVLDFADAPRPLPLSDRPQPPQPEAAVPAVPSAPRPAAAPTPVIGSPAVPKPSGAVRQQRLDLQEGPWRLPPLTLLAAASGRPTSRPSEDALAANARLLETVLEDYGVRGRIAAINPGPVVTLYELEPAPGTKSARVIGLADDIARNMHVTAVRIATVPGRNVIGIELPNAKRETVLLGEMFGSEDWARNTGRLPLALGKDIGGNPVIADLARMPHLLIAGTTGSGKSVAINTMILSLLWRFSPDECRFIMIDPKMLELSVYDRIPHLLAPVVTEPPKAIGALKWTVREMERRYRAMSQLGVRNIGGYNERVTEARRRGQVLTRRVQTGFDPETGRPSFEEQPLVLEPLPMIVVVIDEMADLMIVAGKEIEAAVQRLAQMARAAGIHVIMATQRPSVDVITGTIKANFPTRISFQVTSKIDSRTILGEMGAEQLLGQGDMLHMAGGGRVSRVHGPFVSDEEVERVVEFLREQGEPAYVEEVTEAAEELEGGDGISLSGIAGASEADKALFDQAVALVTREGKASTSFIQRGLKIGYNRAANLIEQMEKEGVVGPANHVGKREVLARRSSDDD